MSDTVDNGVEYALYWLALKRPDVLAEARRFGGKMLASDRDALRDAKALLATLMEGALR